MIQPKFFYDLLLKNGIQFFAGVPDSLLKDFCAYVTDHSNHHVITANEGGAIGMAAGFHLSTGSLPVVYLQNSGLGNIVNPIASMAHEEIYSIPMLLIVGWRGFPGEKDEPQHVKQGKVTEQMLQLLDIPYVVLSENEAQAEIDLDLLIRKIKEMNKPGALLVKKGTFDKYKLQSSKKSSPELLSREKAIQLVTDHVDKMKDSTIISTTGMISRELFSYRNDQGLVGKDFYNVGSMGHASQIASGIALAMKNKKVFCYDGDGAALMHLGGLAITASLLLENFIHVVFDNEAHDSVGGQPTCTSNFSLEKVALSCGYKSACVLKNQNEISDFFNNQVNHLIGPIFILIKVAKGNREDLMRPNLTPQENKLRYIKNLRG